MKRRPGDRIKSGAAGQQALPVAPRKAAQPMNRIERKRAEAAIERYQGILNVRRCELDLQTTRPSGIVRLGGGNRKWGAAAPAAANGYRAGAGCRQITNPAIPSE